MSAQQEAVSTEQETTEQQSQTQATQAGTQQANTEPAKAGETSETAPKTYTVDDLKAPEGFELTAEVKAEVAKLIKDGTMTEEDFGQFQAMVNIGAQSQQQVISANEQAMNKMRDEWVGQIKNDKEFGGSNFESTVAAAKRAVTSLGSPDFAKFIEASGLGDHPEFIKAFARADKLMGEERRLNSSGSGLSEAAQREADMRALYPSMYKK